MCVWLLAMLAVVAALGAAESRIPFVSFSEAFARQGALLAFYPDPEAVGQQRVTLATQVLRGETRASKIGVRRPDSFHTAVNRHVEDQLGQQLAPELHADVEFP